MTKPGRVSQRPFYLTTPIFYIS
ncbi:MAG: hypothetical protein QOI11_3476, partial [Candidatus Eremiobacteraeota bacterium]|nr:hypothetical protein [Candidatus Eremiobacteraeota bacterium]